MKKLLFGYLLTISVIIADGNFYEENLNGFGFCSANFLILSTSQDTLTSKAYNQAEQISLKFAQLYYKEFTNKIATQRDMSILRTTYLNRLEQEYKRFNGLTNATYEKIGKCETFVQTILQNQENIEISLNQAEKNVVTKRRLLESLAFTNNKAMNIPREKVLEIYKKWIESKSLNPKKPVTKFIEPNMKFMK